MHSWFFCHWSTRRLDGLHNFSYACQCGPLCWWWGRFSSHIYWYVQHGWYLSISGIFSFTRCVVQHLELSKKIRGIRSVIGGSPLIVCVWNLRRSLLRCWWKCWLFPHDLDWLSRRSLILSPSRRVNLTTFDWRGYCSILVSWCIWAPKFSEGLPWNCKQWPGKSSPSLPYVFVVLWQRRSRQDLFSYLRRYFLCTHLSF